MQGAGRGRGPGQSGPRGVCAAPCGPGLLPPPPPTPDGKQATTALFRLRGELPHLHLHPHHAACGGRGGIQATQLLQSWSSWATEGTPAVTTDDTALLREPTAWRRRARAPTPPGSPADPLGRGPGPACCGEPASTGRGAPWVQAAVPIPAEMLSGVDQSTQQ